MADPILDDDAFARLSLPERLLDISRRATRPVFTTSLGIEDQAIAHAIALSKAPIRIVTLDTGRLFPETIRLIEQTEQALGIAIERFHPHAADEDAYVAAYGRDGFYESVEARHACCGFRKLKPLALALAGADGWITGLRRGQSDARSHVPFAEHDEARGLFKFNPLADWDADKLREYVETHAIPVNPLHARGYPSIGCEPCTRAIRPGESERAGRWWWENDAKRECGLHVADATPQAA